MNKIFCIVLTLLLVLNVGCFDDGTDCGSSVPSYLNIEGLTGQNVVIGSRFADFDTLGTKASASYRNFGIRATPEAVYSNEAAGLSGGFRVYACSPIPPQPTEEIDQIAVFSSADYSQAASDKVFVAGDTLNAIIKIYEPYSGRIAGLPDFLIEDDLAAYDEPFTLQLTSAPDQVAEHQFTVHYRLENGEFYQFTTDLVTITP